MPALDDVTRMRLVGGNLGLDFINTRTGLPPVIPSDDLFDGYGGLVAWAAYAGAVSETAAAQLRRLAHEDPLAADAAFARSRRVREDLDEVFRTLVEGREADDSVLNRLREDESDALRSAHLRPGAVFAWTWDNDRSLARPLWPVVHEAIRLLLTGPLDRIKQCGGCRYLFLDESRNHTRRWCSMEDCGTDEKIRRYVTARRASRETRTH
jgi:predicted RNA-binding Zn ribbon-like protein